MAPSIAYLLPKNYLNAGQGADSLTKSAARDAHHGVMPRDMQ